MIKTINTETKDAIPVVAPDSWLMADLEKLEVDGYALNQDPIILLRPRAISSWLGLILYSSCFASNDFPIEIVSKYPTITSVKAIGSNSFIWLMSNSGNEKEGKPDGMSFTMATSKKSLPKYWIVSIPETTTINAFGIFLFIFLKLIITATEINPIIVVWELKSVMVNQISSNTYWIWSLWMKSTPNKFLNWLIPMVSATADVNPEITGFDRKFTTKPSLKLLVKTEYLPP